MGAVEDARHGGIDLTPWAKFDHQYGVAYPVLFHMLDVAVIAGELWHRFLSAGQRKVIAAGLGLPEKEARKVVMFLAGLHDLGKLSRFQTCEPSAWAQVSDALQEDTGGWVRVAHERASMHAAVELLAELGYGADDNTGAAVRAAQILGGHHGRFLQIDLYGAAHPARVRAVLGGPRWQDLRRRYVRLLQHLTAAHTAPGQISAGAAVLIAGMGMVADRLASQRHHWLPNALAPAFGAAEHHTLARKSAAEVVRKAGLARTLLPEAPFAQVHPRATAPNPLQTSVLEHLPVLAAGRGPGILVVTDATGAGKTTTALEAARIFTAHCGTFGACWLLPTTATADAAWETLHQYVAAHHPEHAPVSLVHSHSWLNAAYTSHIAGTPLAPVFEHGTQVPSDAESPSAQGQPPSHLGEDPCIGGDVGEDEDGQERQRATVPDGWLRGWDRALLAQFCVATLDQALMSVLPVRHSALRMLALSGKTVIIDEAHAFEPFTQLQLRRLLHWLGALRVPVVVLSATLPASTSEELVRSYLLGAGHRSSRLAERSFAPAYPGWLFADVATADPKAMGEPARRAHAARQRREATMTLTPVRYQPLGEPGRTIGPDERLARIAAEIRPVTEHGGCAAVVCATVADAQDTYRHLRTALPWPQDQPEQLMLLHARFPGHRREAAIRRVRALYGPDGERPGRAVVVTTSLLDVSLDIDVDVMVSDLASLARLLQRMGRLWRFELHGGLEPERRPAWARAHGARMTVLDPVGKDGATVLPPGWDALEPAFLQHATAALLRQHPTRTLTLPDDLQHLVEQIHGAGSGFARATEALQRRHTAHLATRSAEEHLSAIHLVPPPARISSLADLHRQYLTAATAATRLGTLPKRLLPCYRTPHCTLALDPEGARPLPPGPLRPAQIRTVLQHTLPVPAAWVAGRTPAHAPPADWRPHTLLADLVLLPHDTTRPAAAPPAFGRHLLRLDPDLGLVHHWI